MLIINMGEMLRSTAIRSYDQRALFTKTWKSRTGETSADHKYRIIF